MHAFPYREHSVYVFGFFRPEWPYLLSCRQRWSRSSLYCPLFRLLEKNGACERTMAIRHPFADLPLFWNYDSFDPSFDLRGAFRDLSHPDFG